MIRKIIYYPITFIAFIFLTLAMPYFVIKEYRAISEAGTFKLIWLINELSQYYKNLSDVIGMLVIG